MRHLIRSSFLLLVMGLPGVAQDVFVSGAASLSEAFKTLGQRFEQRHPGVHIVLNTGASDTLLQQIAAGAPADVFASADEATMDRAATQGLLAAQTRRTFAGNALVLIVPSDAKRLPKDLRDLTDPFYTRIAVGHPSSVPAGRYAKEALASKGLWGALEGRCVFAQSVRQALDYVARGEAEAGFVYTTDAATQPNRVKVITTVPTPTPITYPIAAIRGSKQGELAQAFVQFVLSAEGREVLTRFGFTKSEP